MVFPASRNQRGALSLFVGRIGNMYVAGSMVQLLVLLLLLIAPLRESYAGFERRFTGARSMGAAGTLDAFGDGPWCFYLNPAQITDMTEAALFYTPSVDGLSEVRGTGISFRSNAFGVNYSFAVQTFGFDMYRETVMTANLSTPLRDFLFVGSNVNVNHLFIEYYGTEISVSLDAGARMFLSDNFSLAFSVTNLSSTSMTLSEDRLPQAFAGGIGYLSEALDVGVEYYKEIGFPSSVRIAAEYSPVRYITVRSGTASGTNSFNAGLSLRLSSFEVDYGAMFHRVLGTTHSFGVSFRVGGGDRTEYESIRQYRGSMR